MNEDEKGFLARWSQRKRDAGKDEPKPAAPDEPTQEVKTSPATVSAEAEPPVDLASLPKLEELTPNTDMTVFFRKGVPESLRNAALRKSWALDPAIRNYVNPALDYAYDWNTPGGVPGSGELAPGTDIARMVLQIIGGGDEAVPSQQAVDKSERADASAPDAASARVAEQTQTSEASAAPAQPVRLSHATQKSSENEGRAESDEHPATAEPAEHRSFASQHDSRRHGGARPK